MTSLQPGSKAVPVPNVGRQNPISAPAQSLEPWLRGTLTHIDALRRQCLHALLLTEEDIHRWCTPLTDPELNSMPFGLPSVAYQIRHISRSLDRLLTYAEGRQLSEVQLATLASEADPETTQGDLQSEFDAAIRTTRDRLLAFDPALYEEPRHVGRAKLPTTLGGLIIHCAEHTQRHTGQAITTSKLIYAMRLP